MICLLSDTPLLVLPNNYSLGGYFGKGTCEWPLHMSPALCKRMQGTRDSAIVPPAACDVTSKDCAGRLETGASCSQ